MKPLTSVVKGLSCLVVVFALSCERSVEKNTVNIQIAHQNAYQSMSTPLSSNLRSLSSAPLTVTAASQNTGTWLNVNPTGYTEKYALNCFFVTVDYPETTRSNKPGRCYIKDASTPNHVFDELAGPVFYDYAAAEFTGKLAMSVVNGKARTFNLFGMHASSQSACIDFKSSLFSHNLMTKPFYLGQATDVDVLSGQDVNVTVAADKEFTAKDYFDICDAPNFGALDSAVSPPDPHHYEITVATGILGDNIYLNQCVPVVMGLKDKSGTKYVTNPEAGNIVIAVEGAAVPSFSSAYDCLSSVSATSAFTFPGMLSATRWIKTDPAAFTTSAYPNVNFHSSTLSLPNFLLYPSRGWDFFVTSSRSDSSTSATTTVSIPSIAKNGACQAIAVSTNSFDWNSAYQMGSSLSILAQDAGGASLSKFVEYYNSSDCSGPEIAQVVTNKISFAPNQWDRWVGYVKYTGAGEGKDIDFFVFHTVGTNNMRAHARVKFIGNSGPSLLPDRAVAISGPTQLLRGSDFNKCIGPFRASLVDKYGVENRGSSSILRNFKLEYDTAQLSVYSAPTLSGTPPAPCSAGQLINPSSATSNFSLGWDSASTFFYVKPLSSSTDVARDIYLYDLDGVLAPGMIRINLNYGGGPAPAPAPPPTITPIADGDFAALTP